MTRCILLILFFASGACGLAYQVVWLRSLELIFGVTSFATATILASFMAGLALGSLYFGRIADRLRNPLRTYGFLEVGIGVYAAFFPHLTGLLTPLLVDMQRFWPGPAVICGRFAVCFLLVLAPTLLMGGTLPVMSKAAITRLDRRGRLFGLLYGANTLGAVAGCLLAGFVTIRLLGVRESVYAAAAVNLAIGIAAIAWSMVTKRITSQEPPQDSPPPEKALSAPLFATILTVFGVSGFCALAYEVLWARALVFFFTSNTYAFTTMLASFLLSSACGTLIAAFFIDRFCPFRSITTLAALQAGIGFAAGMTLWEFGHLDRWMTAAAAALGAGVRGFYLARFLFAMLVMAPAGVLFGMAFPLAFRLLSQGRKAAGRSAGDIYAINTMGCILGSLAAGFAIVPSIGVTRGIITIACVNCIAACALMVANPKLHRRIAIAACGALIASFAVLAIRAPRAPFVGAVASFNSIPGAELVYYGEDHTGSSWVQTMPGGFRRLGVNANVMAENGVIGILEHKLASHLPLLLHPEPKTAICVGLGMGMTAHAALQHGVTLDVAELCPSEIEAQRHFEDLNGRVLRHPRCKLRLTDGRNWLLLKRGFYDVIQIGITHPFASSGNAAFYTRDFYEICQRAMREGGIVSQWMPMHDIAVEDCKTLIRTFLRVFPHAVLFLNYFSDNSYIVGSAQPLQVSWRRIAEKMADSAVGGDLATINVTSPYAVWALVALDEEMLRQFAGEGTVFTDNLPKTEFEGLLRKKKAFAQIIEEIIKLRSNGGRTAHDTAQARIPFIRERADSFYDASTHVMRALLAHERGRLQEEMQEYAAAMVLTPGDSTAAYLYRQAQRAVCILEGSAASRRGEFKTTLALYERALELDPQDPGQVELLATLGWLYCAIDVNRAEAYLQKAVALAPRYARARVNLAEVYLRKGMVEPARRELLAALRLEPKNKDAREMLRVADRYRPAGG